MGSEVLNQIATTDGTQPQRHTITVGISTFTIATARSKWSKSLSFRSVLLVTWYPLLSTVSLFHGQTSMLGLVSLPMRLYWELLMTRVLRLLALTRPKARVRRLRALPRPLPRLQARRAQVHRLHQQLAEVGLVRLTSTQQVVRLRVSRF